jgi:hypothetical protein
MDPTTVMTNDDPFDVAAKATAPSSTFFGQISMDLYFCILQKGVGKVVFDPAQHKISQRVTSISIVLTPLAGARMTNQIKRDMIGESREWAGIVRPSIEACGSTPKAVNNKWAKLTTVPTGRKYTDKDGIQKESTTFKFLAVYNTEQECQNAASAFFAGDRDETPETGDVPTADMANNPERKTAEAFLAPFWKMSMGDKTAMGNLLASSPLTAKYFTMSSPEVLAVMTA